MERIIYNIYCDESCHLQNDKSDVLILGATVCPDFYKRNVYTNIRNLKKKHGISSWAEIKWTKVSLSKIDFYLELIEYFFMERYLTYRGVVAPKRGLNHSLFNDGSYDLWFYKMYYFLLNPLIAPTEEYRIFLDVKDTRGGPRIKKLKEVLCNNIYDFKGEVVTDVKQIQSHESEALQLADLFNGALSFIHRGLYADCESNEGKRLIVDRLVRSKGIDLTQSTSLYEQKFNVFVWQPRGGKHSAFPCS